jgi:hypothetical protein
VVISRRLDGGTHIVSRHIIRAVAAGTVSILAMLAATSHADEQLIPLYVFGGQADGSNPNAGLIADRQGNLFGTTFNGGAHACNGGAGCGVVFEVAPQSDGSWKEITLYTFLAHDDGTDPSSPLAMDKAGTLYGHARVAGKGGTVYRLAPSGGVWTFDILYEFPGGSDGILNDYAPLLVEKNKVYGIQQTGGAQNAGSLFELKPPKDGGVPWERKTLFAFPSGAGTPSWLVKDPLSDTIYVATYDGNGAIVALSPSAKHQWTETVLYSFAGGSDGADPSDLIVGTDGTIYGISGFSDGRSDVFSLTPPSGPGGAWTKASLYSAGPYGPSSITIAPNGALVGVEFGEIDFDAGHAFKLDPPKQPGNPWRYKQLWDFNSCCLSMNPMNLVYGKDHQLYGALGGGDSDFGAVFELKR